jgi:hypothetical protein
MNDNTRLMQEDPRFELYSELLKLFRSQRIWGGMEWSYSPIHPVFYRPVNEKVQKAFDDLCKEYGVES